MNTISLVLNGRTAADIARLPARERSTITTLPRSRLPQPPLRNLSSASMTSVFSSSAPPSPGSSRRSSAKASPGWYNTENNLTLDDFARRLNTTSKKLEIWQGRCAQNAVMALLRPTPLILFLLNPICLVLWVVLGFWWVTSGGASGKETTGP